MRGIILERRGDYAAVLREDGAVLKLRRAEEVGETVELTAEILPMPSGRSRWRSVAAAALAVAVLGGAAFGFRAGGSVLFQADRPRQLFHAVPQFHRFLADPTKPRPQTA